MGIDDFFNSGLVLGLGLSSPSSTVENKSKRPSTAQKPNRPVKINEPSLTLSLFDHQIHHPAKKVDFDFQSNDHQQDHSAASSLISNVSVKRERGVAAAGSEEVEIERVNSSRASDEDDDGSNGRKKLRLTKAQSALLEESFTHHSTLNPKQKQELARELKLRPRQVEVWFQNRRARTKLKQTEVDCELLKKCCETLTDENRRLQKELQELKLAKPLYMQLPAATLNMCPSCERLAVGGPDNAAKTAFNMAPKPHFYNPFMTNHPSAAC
ncbi:homeobox-leucine zipper protein hat22 [Phtheirospermum japonicum]|uniref:Homeobox-leucine zipper protein hat22 n=1 Tax=Phtheirospermum japonicum TaxID=374723 RepID=A0A830B3V0_9LAMI|nr:homeobox-leucine zipper protein hat22 [Phtheirospermum japonicum]